jgi:hypothetical protein
MLKVKIEKGELVIRIPLQEPRRSASGKTMVVATTSGNQPTEATINGKTIILGLNAYYKP